MSRNHFSIKYGSGSEKYGLPEKYFLFLATLEPRKNLTRLIEAYRIFNKSNPEK